MRKSKIILLVFQEKQLKSNDPMPANQLPKVKKLHVTALWAESGKRNKFHRAKMEVFFIP